MPHLACLPDGDTEHFMDQCLMVPLMQVAHASRQGVQDADELLDTVVIAILQSLLLHYSDLIHQAAQSTPQLSGRILPPCCTTSQRWPIRQVKTGLEV